MTVIGKTIDGGVESELAYAVFAHPAVEHLKCGQLIHRHHGSFMLHQSPQDGAKDFTCHSLQPFARR